MTIEKRIDQATKDPANLTSLAKNLKRAVDKLAPAILSGEVEAMDRELVVLARLCDTAHLPIEAARVRRWMEHPICDEGET